MHRWNKLSDTAVRTMKPRDKEYAVNDGNGLYLIIRPSGTRSWSFRYTCRDTGKGRKLGLGGYPATSLALAREKARAQQELIAQGIDPRDERQRQREKRLLERLSTFGKVASTWYERECKLKKWGKQHQQRVTGMLDNHILPWIGKKPLSEITRPEIARLLDRVVQQGLTDTPKRVRSIIASVFDYAIEFAGFPESENFMRGRNVGGLISHKSTPHAAITEPEKLAKLLRDIRQYRGNLLTRTALQLMPYLFQRPGQIRMMRWEHIDFDNDMWICPAEMMKMRADHKVPLPWQAVELLRDLEPLTGSTGMGPVFPNMSRAKDKKSEYMSNSTINKALRSMGYCTKTDITGHGFRATAQTLTQEELSIPKEWSERHLAHVVKDQNGESYDRAKFVKRRGEMIQLWADYLDYLADDSNPAPTPLLPDNVVSISRRVA